MRRPLTVLAAALALLTTPAAAITYNIDFDFGGGAFLTGTIETDGTLGVFDGDGEFLSWSFDFSDGVNNGSLQDPDIYQYSSLIAGDPGAWFATETSLSFDFAHPDAGRAIFVEATGDGLPQIGFCSVNAFCPPAPGAHLVMILVDATSPTNQVVQTPFDFDRDLVAIGEAAPVSLPGTLPLMLGALGFGWLCCRSQVRRAAK